MNKSITFLVSFLLLLMLSNTSFCYQPEDEVSRVFDKKEIQNLVSGLESKNLGVVKSCIYFAGKYKVNEVVDNLIRKINCDSLPEDVKVLSAKSIYQIGNSRGIYQLSQTGKFSINEKLRRICTLLYNDYINKEFAEK